MRWEIDVKIRVLEHGKDLGIPKYMTSGSVGMDLYAAIDEKVYIRPGRWALIPTGICIELPEGYEAQIRSRSGQAAMNGVFVLNSPGTIDSDYRGEIMVILANFSDADFCVWRGMRIAQMVISPIVRANFIEVKHLDETKRGIGGFGSTGC
ncbi:MAG: deoxyuridine 5'-triphosphate nucleotidohydrolase [Candidatus Dojkabacteria bacterium]|nr:MAG: deoxyuridine 5'-triphosphate nucleotidohydrolase [Candidatus Dojkabacteria bacterium]